MIGKRTTLDAATIGGTANSRVWWLRLGLLAVGMTATYIVVIGAPIVIIPNPLFHPMTPAGTWNYVSWLLPAAMFGPLLATFLVPWPQTVAWADASVPAGSFRSSLSAAPCATSSSWSPSALAAPSTTSVPSNRSSAEYRSLCSASPCGPGSRPCHPLPESLPTPEPAVSPPARI